MPVPACRENKPMNKPVWRRLSVGQSERNIERRYILIFVFIFSIIIGLVARPLPVTAGHVVASEQSQSPAPTPTPVSNTAGSNARSFPILAILVFLAPLAYLAWHSRGQKTPITTGSCGAPVVDGNKRPFQIFDDERPPKNQAK